MKLKPAKSAKSKSHQEVVMISIEHHNSTSNRPVNTKSSISSEFIPFFLSENSKGDLYKICQGITWFVVKLGSHRIPRVALASFAGCHVDTVSSVNMRLEEAGIFSIGRALRKPNVYSSEFLHSLSVIFGYVKYYTQSSASHILNLLDFSYSSNYKESDSSTEVGVIFPTREENESIPEKITKSDTKSPTRTAPVLCPSAYVQGMFVNPDDYCMISTGQLFAEEERKREVAEINAKWAERARKDAEEVRLRKLEEAKTPRVTKEQMIAILKANNITKGWI